MYFLIAQWSNEAHGFRVPSCTQVTDTHLAGFSETNSMDNFSATLEFHTTGTRHIYMYTARTQAAQTALKTKVTITMYHWKRTKKAHKVSTTICSAAPYWHKNVHPVAAPRQRSNVTRLTLIISRTFSMTGLSCCSMMKSCHGKAELSNRANTISSMQSNQSFQSSDCSDESWPRVRLVHKGAGGMEVEGTASGSSSSRSKQKNANNNGYTCRTCQVTGDPGHTHQWVSYPSNYNMIPHTSP